MATISWRARSLKAALKSALRRSGMSEREVARQLGVNHMKVNRWLDDETPAPNAEDTASFLAVIEVVGDERERILSMARSDDADWLVSGPPGINPQLATVMECERYATRITECAPLVFPGLLQTGDYARAIIGRGSPTLTDPEIANLVMIRNARREALTRVQPIEFTAFIGTPAIHGGIGGRDVMIHQLTQVTDLARRPNVTIQAFDTSGEWSPALAGPFILYEFDHLPATVYLEHHRSGVILVDETDVADYKTAAETIRREAMSPEDTAELIADAIPTMETTE
jgi:hypothetical protein